MSARPLPYPVAVTHRDLAAENAAGQQALEVFESDLATAINRARLEHLASLGLPLAGRSVLDVGGGVGHLAQFFAERGCRVLSTDARRENVAHARRLYPSLDARVLDVEGDDVTTLGRFDVVFCYGLLYHLENPILALRKLAAVCDDLLLLETLVCDSAAPVLHLYDESLSANQALRGVGCRPSPSFIVLALDRAGFEFVYAPAEPPEHPDYRFTWRDNLDVARDGFNLRCVFVASRRRLESDRLAPLVR